MTKPPELFQVSESQVHPDERCEGRTVVFSPHATEHWWVDCVLHHEHDPQIEPHADGDGAFWGDNGEVEYR
ncbi:hypothetical protein [Actinoplanes sp. NPDC051494]|uniref:hypothetical protein n=1 Tax=Actinoplanes sp. NPDC051494 TaxID=3363907 RepID=UPI0037B33C32